ncbi:MAG TPA: DUF424 family protein [Methanotrichaceae archaeon]|nr:DUF424 family protein [Methanotrichaceae archaeon]
MCEDAPDELYLKVHTADRDVLVAACDCNVMGKTFKEGQLQVEVCSDFFGLEKATPADLERAMKKATIANFIGKKAVDYAIKMGYVNKDNVLVIDGVPCAQMVVM